MKKNLTRIAGGFALAIVLSVAGAAVAQAKAPARHHVRHASVARDYGSPAPVGNEGGGPNILDWLTPGASETSAPALGLVTDLLEGL